MQPGKALPAGLPSSLLERRPDIAAAQRTMEASNARIGVARAAMFPALNLGASGGGVAGTFADIFKTSGQTWMLDALLSAPLIDGGRNKANVKRSEAALEESVAAYRQSVLLAFAEVEDNLAGLRTPCCPRAARPTWRRSCMTPAGPATWNCSTRSATWRRWNAARFNCAAIGR
jgi:outer membrane protein TolC